VKALKALTEYKNNNDFSFDFLKATQNAASE
jgi:hypothetical protein